MKKQRVAIVGGSYAGLSLARTLHTHYPNRFHLCLFELLSEHHMATMDGSFLFHDADTTLAALQLVHLGTTPVGERTNKQEWLHALASSLPQNTIRYNTHVSNIAWDLHSQTFALTVVHGDDDRCLQHSFDIVIAADGLTSPLRHTMLAKEPAAQHMPFFLLGDAARQFGREWCFGVHRTRYGASRGMADAVQLGLLLGKRRIVPVEEEEEVAGEDEDDPLAAYRLLAWTQRRQRNTGVVLVALCVLLVWWLLGSETGIATRPVAVDL